MNALRAEALAPRPARGQLEADVAVVRPVDGPEAVVACVLDDEGEAPALEGSEGALVWARCMQARSQWRNRCDRPFRFA